MDLIDQSLVLGPQGFQTLEHRGVRFRVQPAEGKFLEFLAKPLHPHTPGKRRIDVHRLLGDGFSLGRLHMLQRPHVVQTVRQLASRTGYRRDGEQQLPKFSACSARHQIGF